METNHARQILASSASAATAAQRRLFLAVGRTLVATIWLAFGASSSYAQTAPRMSNGEAVDWCLHWGVDCGKPAADEYCRRTGHTAGAASFTTARMHPTYVLGDNKTCNEDYCVGFTSLACAAGA